MFSTFMVIAMFCVASSPLAAQLPTFALSDASPCPDGTFEIDVSIANFTDIISFQFTTNWDTDVMRINEVISSSVNEDVVDNLLFGTVSAENPNLTVSWFDQTIVGVDLADDDVLFTLSFDAVGDNASSSMITFENMPTAQEVSADVNGDIVVIDADFNDGLVMVSAPELAEVVIDDDMEGTGSGSINITVSGIAPFTYLWNNDADTEDLVNLSMGDYSCMVTAANQCASALGPFTVDNIVNINEIEGLQAFNLFPNPAQKTSHLEVRLESVQEVTLSVFNILGEKVFEDQQESANIELDLDLSSLTAGSYLVQVATKDGMQIKKLEVLR